MGPEDLDKALCGVDIPDDPNVLAGIRTSEDAGVYRLNETTALVQTIDFFTPIVDDPRIFGRAAAANSLSDVYAMGGKPLTAMNVVCFPVKKLGIPVLRQILEGGLDIIKEAGVALVGGHSVEDDEPKYGLSVTGIVHPDHVMVNSGLRPGDTLILTKPIGTGVIATALKAGLASEQAVEGMIRTMCSLNAAASEVAVRFGVKACTDITGFGLVGHLVEMARASKCRVHLWASRVPLLEGAWDAASMGLVPAGAHANREFFSAWTEVDSAVSPVALDLLVDPQTSGGLIVALPSALAEEFLTEVRRAGVEVAVAVGTVAGVHEHGRLIIENR
jgi:selenide, water dikinase